MILRMSNGLLGNSKNTLMFAGGILLSSALIASALGDDQTPEDRMPDPVIEITPAEPRAASRSPERSRSNTDSAIDYSDWVEDDELIDDTVGFSTNPGDEVSVVRRGDDVAE